MPGAARAVGSVHGLFFLMFVVALFRVAVEQRWPARRAWLALVASVVPLGTFVLDRSLRRDVRALASGVSLRP